MCSLVLLVCLMIQCRAKNEQVVDIVQGNDEDTLISQPAISPPDTLTTFSSTAHKSEVKREPPATLPPEAVSSPHEPSGCPR
ncbi:MAG: hypothetical protein IPN29_14550 [Saprospiraceae bacterium]|nr:hypothetical protein [Saprospiraceae bacterium]